MPVFGNPPSVSKVPNPENNDALQCLIDACTPNEADPQLLDPSLPPNPPPPPPPRSLLGRVVDLVSSPFKASPSEMEEDAPHGSMTRPRRATSQTHFYQSEEEAEKERSLKSKMMK